MPLKAKYILYAIRKPGDPQIVEHVFAASRQRAKATYRAVTGDQGAVRVQELTDRQDFPRGVLLQGAEEEEKRTRDALAKKPETPGPSAAGEERPVGEIIQDAITLLATSPRGSNGHNEGFRLMKVAQERLGAPAPDLYAALGLMERVKNVVSGSLNYHKAAVEWITEAKQIVSAAANQGLKDELHAVAEEERVLLRRALVQGTLGPALRRDIEALVGKQEDRKPSAVSSDEPDVSTDAIEGILLTTIGSNATLPSGVEVVGFEDAANALATLIDEREQWIKANQPSTDDLMVPKELARQVNSILKLVLKQSGGRYITPYAAQQYVKPFDDLVRPKQTRTFHVEVRGTKFDLEQVLATIRTSTQNLESSISEDTE